MKNILIKNVPDYIDEARLLERISGLINAEISRNAELDPVIVSKRASAKADLDAFKTGNNIPLGR